MTAQSHYQPCEECGAPLDPQQRYCVNCAARRGNGANPASRYFAAMSKRARRPVRRPPAKSAPTSRAAAVGFFALLPIAVALGVMVGRSGSSNNDQALLEALRRQNAAAARASAGNTTTASTSQSEGQGHEGRQGRSKKRQQGDRQRERADHQSDRLQGDPEAGTGRHEAGRKNPKQVGKNYIRPRPTCQA